MKALTLTQPWATLVAVGAKRIETRSWGTAHRGPLAIHAAKGLAYPVLNETGLSLLIEEEPFATALRPHLGGYTAEERAANLPRGCIVAVTELRDVLPTEPGDPQPHDYQERFTPYAKRTREAPDEISFGDYSAGRYGWLFGALVRINNPIECSGARGLWDVPEGVRRELREITDLAWPPDEAAAFQAKLEDEEIERGRTY